MSFISDLFKLFAKPSPKTPTAPVPPPVNPAAQPTPPKVRSGINVALVDRLNRLERTLPFALDKPELAFEFSLSILMSEPLLYSSIKAERVYDNGTREIIFEVSMYPNPATNTYDYTPSFRGSWKPPEAFKAVQKISM